MRPILQRLDRSVLLRPPRLQVHQNRSCRSNRLPFRWLHLSHLHNRRHKQNAEEDGNSLRYCHQIQDRQDNRKQPIGHEGCHRSFRDNHHKPAPAMTKTSTPYPRTTSATSKEEGTGGEGNKNVKIHLPRLFVPDTRLLHNNKVTIQTMILSMKRQDSVLVWTMLPTTTTTLATTNFVAATTMTAKVRTILIHPPHHHLPPPPLRVAGRKTKRAFSIMTH